MESSRASNTYSHVRGTCEVIDSSTRGVLTKINLLLTTFEVFAESTRGCDIVETENTSAIFISLHLLVLLIHSDQSDVYL